MEKEIPLEVDAGLLAVTDLNPIDAESYRFVPIFRPIALSVESPLQC